MAFGDGAQGYQGGTGRQGERGFQGERGHQGRQGSQGLSGRGAQGYQGFQGEASDVAGEQGYQGRQGFQGSQGTQGEASDVPGEQGLQGAQGFRFATYQGAFVGTFPTVGDVVSEHGSLYLCHTTGNPGNHAWEGLGAIWSFFLPGFQFLGAYNGAMAYGKGAVVTENGNVYYGNQTIANGGYSPTSYPQYWDLLVPKGAQGFQGEQGIQGTQGSQGFQGFQGEQGFQGRQGEVGAQGSQGEAGGAGAQGLQGEQGRQGFQGLTGEDSVVAGPQGFQGFQGDAGTPGATGTIGAAGTPGAQGEQGRQGEVGAAGAAGGAGAQGFQGDAGATGGAGAQGFQGDVGAQGFQGDKMAIVPYGDRFIGLACVEAGEPRFEEIVTVKLVRGDFRKLITLDDRYVQACEPLSIKAISTAADWLVRVAVRVVNGHVLSVMIDPHDEEEVEVTVKLSGLRKGHIWRFREFTAEQYENNLRFWDGWKR